MNDFLAKVSILAKFAIIAIFCIGWAKVPPKPADLGLSPLQESQAYKQFQNRPVSEYSKTLFLIERFKNLPHEIVYEGRSYKLKAVSGMASAFLRFNYKKEQTAKQWILKYTHRSLWRNELIMLRLKDGSSHRAGEVLNRELEALEQTMKEIQIPKIELPTLVHVRLEGKRMVPEAIALPTPSA